MVSVRVGVIAEDVNYLYFLRPAMRKLGSGFDWQLVSSQTTSGCRSVVLRQRLDDLLPACDLVVIGADAKSRRGAVTYRRKARDLARFLGEQPKLVYAVADPSIEAWLLSDLPAFAGGIEAGTGDRFRLPSRMPDLSSEATAKSELGRLIQAGCGGPLPRAGFEYATEIVARMGLLNSGSPSLAAWAHAFAGRLEAESE